VAVDNEGGDKNTLFGLLSRSKGKSGKISAIKQ